MGEREREREILSKFSGKSEGELVLMSRLRMIKKFDVYHGIRDKSEKHFKQYSLD